jgi:hypothetical protein
VHVPPGKPAFLDLMDLAGRRVYRETIPPTALDGMEIDMRPRGGLRPGVYMLRLKCGDATVARRVAVLR